MPISRPGSRSHSRANSIHEAPVVLPHDQRANYHDGLGHHHANNQDPKLFGPGFSSAAPHSAAEAQVRYVLVTPEMMNSIDGGVAPHTSLIPMNNGHLQAQSRTPDVHHHPEKSDASTDGKQLSPASELDEELFLPNPIARMRYRLKEYFGEFIGTMVLIIFGNGVNCQVVLSGLTQGSYLSISFGWGIGVMFGVYIAGGISGAHLNPAVTISLAAFRGFPWRKVPGYALAQILGAFCGSVLIQSNYYALINQFEGGYAVRTFNQGATSTGALFFTAAQPYVTNINAWCNEVFATAVLLAVILCLGDANNNPAPAGMNGLILMFLILGIGATLGTQTAYCLNPARDLGPRIAAACFGYGKDIWTYRNGYFFWTCWVATIFGGLVGCFVYDFFLFAGPESPLNKPWGKKKQAQIEG